MATLLTKMSSCDAQASVCIAGGAVFRLVDRSHADSVLSVIKSINSAGIEGIVQTEVCADGEVAGIIDAAPDALVLKHKKIAHISYPHEWCAPMLKDAALFHLDLSKQLYGQGLFLKDAHPWNILFERGRPVFVDFTSIVSKESLFAEEYLESNKLSGGENHEARLARVFKEIFDRMYLPYFINPLRAYAFGQRSLVRKAIENTTLNSSTSTISIRKCLPTLRLRLSTITKTVGLLRSCIKMNKVLRRLNENRDVAGFYQDVHEFVTNLKVAIGASAYSAYYKLKGEDHDWAYSEEWNAKQKSVYNALNTPGVDTVLDVACNTGWFAVMAAKMGKQVVAFDIDEACVETLYSQVKNEQLDVLPLVMNFTELTTDRFSIHDGGKVLINATDRLRSDSVIALGIIHHLTLGLGLTFEEVLNRLLPLCEKQLVIEFVDATDAMIQNEPSFFPAYFRNKELFTGYELGKFIGLCEERGFEVWCEKSHPDTRTIVVCRKLPTT